MNLQELDSYNLADAVKFNKTLNPRLWQKEQMRPEVRDKLLEIAADFKEFLGLSDLEVKDITVSGSNAGYTYTPYSDIDLHLVIDIPQADNDDVYRELFDAKKYQYNDLHNIKIGGYDVELYVENANKPPVSQGVFSVLNNDWINIPRYRKSTVDDDAVRSKYEDFKHRIDDAVKSNDMERIDSLAKKIKTYRQAGLDAHGELGPENLAYKMLRTQGYIAKLYDAKASARDAELSLAEQNKVKKPFVYGYKSVAEDATATPDGVSPTTQMFLNEKEVPTQEEIIRDFLNFVVEKLNIDQVPKLRLKKDPEWSIRNHSFGRYDNATGELIVALGNRHIMDVLRTLAHELTHRKQDEREDMPADAGETGSSFENEANAKAGVLMRDYAELHPEYFQDVTVAESSGYIPTAAQSNDPRFKMALTVDVHPGQTGKEANKMALKTNKQGKPGLLMKTANMIGEAAKSKTYGYNSTPITQEPGEVEDDLGNQEATGPEFEPQMPAGTTKVDVKDLTDWYRLGMDISDMDDADPEDYNQGPPQTVIVFPSDEAEQGYLKQFKRLGLKTHDIDPDVAGGEDKTGKHLNKALAEELEAFKAQDLFEVKMTSKNLANLAKGIKGVKVGLEFEMIVPNASVDDDGEQEPDYDYDEEVRDIDDAVSFFDDGDYNYGRTIRNLREEMESSYREWVTEQIDSDWDSNGFEYFKEYMEREEPFDPVDHQDRAEDEIKTEFPDLDPTSEDFEELVAEKLREIENEYYNETWQMEGRGYDRAREEFDDEKRGDYSERDWLRDQGIRSASDVMNEYTDLTWPHWTTFGGGDTDVKAVALDFMNAIGDKSVAISNSYHGSYEKWNGSEWVRVGSDKPDDCFTIEPDGSLDGNESSDAGLEFVSPPIPLEDIGTTMKKVQDWAGTYGAYTGKNNKTSIHTNISVPGYDLKNLDYLKAALLLGDEHVLREFDRIGNSYAKPAIAKIKELVRLKPEKAQELLDKMKSQLNAEASKLIHSGTTDKFTSINTKDNRVEFRSPGGDYLSIIADNPQKMVDTINRMVVTLDAAMDPNKYKEEYQKKLYKLLTGQGGGREAKTGAKQEMKASDKDLLNIFSRYAAGELPKAALKSFVRQAQLERKGKKADAALASHNWAIRRRATGDIVRTFQADDYNQAFEVLQQYKRDHNITDDSLMYGRYNPSEETPQPTGPQWGVWDNDENRFIDRFGGTRETPVTHPSEQAALVWANRAGQQWRLDNGQVEVRQVPQEQPAQSTPDGEYAVFSPSGREYGRYNTEADARAEAQRIANQNDAMVNIGRGGLIVTSVQPQPATDAIRQAVGRNIAAQSAQTNQGNWGIWLTSSDRFVRAPNQLDNSVLRRFPSREAAEQFLAQTRGERPDMRTDIEVREIEPAAATGVNNLTPRGPGPWEVASRENNQVYYNIGHTNRGAAETEARTWLSQNSHNPDYFEVRTRESVSQQAPNWEIRDGSTNRLVHQFYAPDRQEAAIIAGDFYDDNDLVGDNYTVQSTESGTDAAQGGIITTANEPATGSQVGQTYNPSGTGSFTGQWLVLNANNQVIYRFGGIGNAQSDANRIAMDWLTQNPRQMVDGVTVVPEMG